jgi:methyl-accepting chemotaxis protein
MKALYKRRHFLVDQFQYRLLGVTIGHLAIFTVVLAVTLFLPLSIKLQDTTLGILEKGRAAEVFLSLDIWFWPTVLAVLVLLGAHSVIVSHRIAGPLVGFRRVLKAVGEGDLSVRARIRRRDYLQKDAESINAMIAGLSGRLQEIQNDFGRICVAWTESRASLSRVSTDEATRSLEQLGVDMDALKARVEQFKIGR